ncbi:hypothetical protein SAY87_004448 [Trapa incisa]|uniref:C2H2-type domain-containing protein n=1 Tax=Trapa incisa TaxID=236973 RepID=A0AAN7JNV0_9MYRT|nr:hypothetical protein SAY87_004448 [Trapa incisa]
MENHDQSNNSASSGDGGHHQVHHCNKCGWPFPSPHPNARHRRAHRKICGTIEGYKFEEESPHTNASDDEHSDDDYKTASAKALENVDIEKGSGMPVSMLHLLEDEVFADAASNFADSTSSTVTEGASENVLEPDSTIMKVKDDVPGPDTAAEVHQTDNSTDSTKKQEQAVPEAILDEPGSKPDTQDHFSSSEVGGNIDFAEKSTTLAASDVLIDNSVPVKTEPLVSIIEETKKLDEDTAVSDCLSESILQGREVTVVEENMSIDAGVILKLMETSRPITPKDSDIAEDVELLSLADKSTTDVHSSTLKSEENFEMPVSISPVDLELVKETRSSSLDDKNVNTTPKAIPKFVETYNLVSSSEFSVSSQVSLSNDNPLAELDMGRELELSTAGNIVHENDGGEENKRFQVFSVPHNVPMVENSERIVEGFKGHKTMGQFQPDDFVVASKFEDPKDLFELDTKKTKSVDGVLIEGELIAHHENRGTTDFKTFKDDSSVGSRETTYMVNASLNNVLPRINQEFSQNSTGFFSCQNSFASDVYTDNTSVDDRSEVEIAHVVEVGQMKMCMKIEEMLGEGVLQSASGMEKVDISEAHYSKRDTEESSAEILKIPESTKYLYEIQVNSENDPIIVDSTSTHVMQDKEKIDITETEVAEAVDSLPESCESDKKPADKTDTVTVAQERVHVTLENLNEGEMNRKDDAVLLSCEHRVVENDMVTSGTAPLVQAPATIGIGGDNGVGGSKASQLHENETDRPTEPPAGSAFDTSVDSRSVNSLDANWGSVSVLSTQSDTFTSGVEDSKAVPSTLNLPKLGSEVSRSSDKSEVFEPPSFMTLVEPGGMDANRTASSNQEQAMWLPSLTNVSTDSPGRKKNEEIIAKVTNWSSNQQLQSPLKSLVDANRVAKPKSPNKMGHNNMLAAAQEEKKSLTVGSILGTEADEKKQVDLLEWNSQTKYPSEIKREKRKVKRSYWAQFMCCSSMN